MAMPEMPKCFAVPAEAPLTDLEFPIEKVIEMTCTHSSDIGSHAWANAFYALDLASSYDGPAAIVRASANGKAFVFYGEDGKPCKNSPGTPAKAEPSHCGRSWGNHVKVLHTGGYVSFYSHLEKVFIKNGARVMQGQPLGLEGWTGAAGHRHLHWGIQQIGGTSVADWEKNIAWDGLSVPFRFKATVSGRSTVVRVPALQCPHAQIGETTEIQPKLRGVR